MLFDFGHIVATYCSGRMQTNGVCFIRFPYHASHKLVLEEINYILYVKTEVPVGNGSSTL